jgi:5-methylcytosine-specific restriction protein A
MNKRYPFNKLQSKTRTLGTVGRPVTTKPQEMRRFGHGVYQSAEWFKLTNELKKLKPFCVRCGVRDQKLYGDHVIELKDGGAALDPNNIQILCAGCHGTKTKEAAEVRRWKPIAEAIEAKLGGGSPRGEGGKS